MGVSLVVEYAQAADLAAHLAEHASRGAVLLRGAVEDAAAQFDRITLNVVVPGAGAEVEAEVLQVIPGLGLAIRLPDPAAAAALCRGASPAVPPTPPSVTMGPGRRGPVDPGEPEVAPEEDPEADSGPRVRGPQIPRGMGVRQWPIEKVLAEWNDLSITDKVQLARRGKRAVRQHILKQQDKKLHPFVLQNPELTPDEVATIVALPGLEPALLQKIAGAPEWTRHTVVARALICHPKMSLPNVQRLVPKVPEMELRRLTRTGRVRASVKRVIIKHLEGPTRRR